MCVKQLANPIQFYKQVRERTCWKIPSKMSLRNLSRNPALQDPKEMEMNEEWNNFVHRVGEVGNLVKGLASGDKQKAEKAKILADQYLEGKVIIDEDVKMTVKSDRTVINKAAFKTLENKDSVRKFWSMMNALWSSDLFNKFNN